MEHAPAWAVALEASSVAFSLRDSTWIYPLANVAHVLGVILLAGSIIVLDLRVIGFGRGIDAERLSRLVTPIAVCGFAMQLVSGALLFTADAAAMAGNAVFLFKMILVIAAVVNAAVFRWWGHSFTSAAARAQAAASMLLWLGVASAGRLIAYF